MNKNVSYFSIVILFLVSCITFVMTPFTTDLKAFFASANQAGFIGKNLIFDAYNSWELKGVFARVFNNIMYKFAIIFADFGTIRFEWVTKLIYVCFVLFICILSVCLAGNVCGGGRIEG